VFWFTSNPVTAYHAVLAVNAAVSAAVMPLAYVACRRLGLSRLLAYIVAAVTALLPAGVFYGEYAMTDAIYPVLVLAWLLAVHSWLTAKSTRGQYAAAAGSALLAGYGYAVHSRGVVIVAGYVAVGVFIAWPPRAAPAGCWIAT
jgi:4-amino-4-deoxy-L-arabinose transferase-like glycosyltransferase